MRGLLLGSSGGAEEVIRDYGIEPIGPDGLPTSLNAILAPPEKDLFASRLWYDTLMRHAMSPGTQAVAPAVGPPGTMVVPLRIVEGRFESLTTGFTHRWRPLTAGWAGPVAFEKAAAHLGRLLRARPPTLLKAMDTADALLLPFQTGLWRAGLSTGLYAHFGNWHETLPPGLRWADYVAARDQPLRNILQRRRAAWEATTRVELVKAPGSALEDAIAALATVRARSWNPVEATPGFHEALIRGAAAAGVLRLGVLRSRANDRPLAAQYWVLSGGQAMLMTLMHEQSSRSLSLGTALTAAMVATFIEEGVGAIDFGRGDEGYKRLWAKSRRQRIGMLVADPRHPAGMVAIARHAAGRGWRQLRGLLATLREREGGE
jgi:hypothetical protein